MLSDEEKKAIKHLKIVAKERTIVPLDDEIQLALNLIEKQSKEIEELKDIKQKICNEELLEQEYVKENFIHKDKIGAKIEEVSNGTYDAKIVLKSLLEKE